MDSGLMFHTLGRMMAVDNEWAKKIWREKLDELGLTGDESPERIVEALKMDMLKKAQKENPVPDVRDFSPVWPFPVGKVHEDWEKESRATPRRFNTD